MLQFELNLNIDIAEQQVQAAINASGTFLPRDLPNPPIYSKSNPADAPILTLALTSNALPLSKVEDYADTTLAQKISQVAGRGAGHDQRRPAARRPHPGQPDGAGRVRPEPGGSAHLAGPGQRQPGQGQPGEPRGSLSSSARTTSCMTSAQYAPLIVAYRNGSPVRLSDVAKVVDGAENVRQAAWMNTTPGGDPEHSAAAGRQHHQRGR